MKTRHLYSFFPMFILLSVLALCFLSEITLFAIFDNTDSFVVLATNINHQSTVRLQPNNKSPFACNLIQNTHILFRFQQTLNNKAQFVCKKQNSHTLFRMKQNSKKHCTHAALSKQFKFIIPGICYTAPLK